MHYLIFLFFILSCHNQSRLNYIDSSIKKDIGYHENGIKSYELSYKYGKLDGVSKNWNDSGTLISIINYKNGLLNGSWNTFYNNGELKNSVIYLNGKKNGLEVWYYKNGQKQSEVLYENNEIISKKLRWDEKGGPIIY